MRRRIIGVVTLFFYLGGFAAAGHAVLTVRTAQGAIAWSVSLVSFPFVALPAYLVFGRSKFEGFVEAYAERAAEIDEKLDKFSRGIERYEVAATKRASMFDALHGLSGFKPTAGNRAELLINGQQTFDSILDGLAAAEDYALVQFYMFHDDGLGRRMKEVLIERARAGVDVYVLYDEIGSQGLPLSYVDDLREAGIEVSAFRPTQGRRNRFQLNFRNHRKIVVVDGRTAWVGGHNVGDEYLGLDPDMSPWRDTHLRLEGPVVQQFQLVTLGDWYWATRQLPELEWQPAAVPDDGSLAMAIPFSPAARLESAGLFFVGALQTARKRIWISAPYFVPDEAVLKALELAALRGIDVRIMVPATNDNLLVQLAAFHFIDDLRGLGIDFCAYGPGFLHEKVLLVDDDISSVGTANFDNRSFRLNFEVTALIIDEPFNDSMESMFETDFANCEPYPTTTSKPGNGGGAWAFAQHVCLRPSCSLAATDLVEPGFLRLPRPDIASS